MTDTYIPSPLGSGKKEKELLAIPRAIVLSPTHELTRQSTAFAKSLCHKVKLKVMGMSETKEGGVGLDRGKMDVLFGTGAMVRRMMGLKRPDPPVDRDRDGKGREGLRGVVREEEEDRERRSYIDVSKVEWLVIDEADVLLGESTRLAWECVGRGADFWFFCIPSP